MTEDHRLPDMGTGVSPDATYVAKGPAIRMGQGGQADRGFMAALFFSFKCRSNISFSNILNLLLTSMVYWHITPVSLQIANCVVKGVGGVC